MPIQVYFARRFNPNSTIDSICLNCYQTVATERYEADLIAADQAHVCAAIELERRRAESQQGTF
jgi:hypothetical protein